VIVELSLEKVLFGLFAKRIRATSSDKVKKTADGFVEVVK